MSADFLRKVKPGDALEYAAALHNLLVDVAADYLRRRAAATSAGRGVAPDFDVIHLKNNSGADRDQYHILGIDTPVITPTDNEAEFKQRTPLNGITPAATHAGKFAVLLEPIADGAFGDALVSGIVTVKVEVSDASHTHADVTVGNATKLTSGTSGMPIVWKDSGTGEKWAVVLLGGGSAGIPMGQYQYQTFQMVSNNNWGWDFTLLHPPIT